MRFLKFTQLKTGFLSKCMLLCILLVSFISQLSYAQSNECATATVLTPGASCVATAGTTVGATQSIPAITCGIFTSSSALDVWYQFTATATSHTVTVVGGAGFDPIIDVRSGACTGTNIGCADATTTGGTETVTVGGLTIGSVYLVRVYGWAGGTGTFTICVTGAPVGPANDNCATATTLTSGTTCTATAGTNVAATQSIAPITCATFTSSSALDVWYQFTAVATTHTVTVVGGAGFDAIIDVRSGACNGTNIACADATVSGGTEVATASGLTIGNVYLVRVYGWAGGTGTFNICVTHVSTAPANNDCASSVLLTPGSTCTPTAGTTVNATQSLAAITCATFTGTADDDVWYRFVATGPNHNVIVVGAAGFDAVVDVRSGACNGTNIACADATVSGGTETVTLSGLTAGTTYLVRVYSFSSLASSQGTFTICVTTPAPANNDCASAVLLTSGTTCTTTAGTTVGATQSLAAITCATFTGTADDDVWYQFVAVSANHTVTVVGAAGFDAVVDVRSGACNGTNIGCADATVSGGTEVVTLSGLTIGATYLVRVYSFSSLAVNQGTFTICVTHPAVPCNCTITGSTSVCTGATGISYSGPAGMTTYAWSISGNGAITSATNGQNVTVTAGAAGSYTLSLTTTQASCTSNTCTMNVTVDPNNTITLTSAAGTNTQTVCVNTAITNITYSTTSATGATFSGLPAGVTGNWAANVVTISGTPTTTVGSPFSYTVTLTGGCGTVTAAGTITVNSNNTVTLTSAAGTNAQTVCINTPITNLTYSTTGATGATFSGLPAGVTGNWAANVVTISGSPTTTVGSPFNYTVTLTGGCGTVTATGTITVMALPVVNAPAVTQPTIATPTGTIVVNATGGPTLEYSVNGAGGPFQLSNTFTGLTPGGSYNVAARLQNSTGCVVLYSGNPIIMNTISGRITDVLVGASPFQDSMWTINLANYQIVRRLGPTLAGFTITGMNGIATNPLTGEHFIILKLSGVTGRVLAKVNVQTGVCTQIGNMGDNFSTLAFKSNGELYSVTGNGSNPLPPETMYKIDTLTGLPTFFRTLGNGADGEVIAFNPDDNFFYHWSGNGTVVWEKFATAVDPIVGLTTPVNGEVFGALYAGAGKIWVSSINSDIRLWDIPTQTTSAVLINTPDDLRGLVKESCPSSLTAGGSTAICSGGSVLLSVNGGVSGYQWYLDGAPIGGANASTYSATAAGVYNCIYMDGCGVTDSVSAGIIVSLSPTPDAVASPASQSTCSGSAVTTIAITGSIGGTVFNWTRDNIGTVTGIAANGAGNISGTLTNTTNAPVTVTFTITPVAGSCTGTPITAMVVVSPTPDVAQPANQVVCNNTATAAVNFTGSVAGTVFNWTNSDPSIGLAASGTGNIASFTATNATASPVVATVTVTPTLGGVSAPTSITMPAQSGTNSPNVRGYFFTAPVNFNITSLFVPTDASAGNQSIAVVRFNGNTPPPVFSTTTNAFTTLFLTQNDATPGNIAVNIPIVAGEVIGIIGYRGTTNSYGNGSSGITIAGNPVSTTRMGMQFPLTTTTPQDLWQEPSSTNISRVLFEYTTAGPTCTGTPRSFTITVNPTPAATISYAGSPYCSNAGTATVTRTGTAGGTYSSTAGLTLNATTGDVTLGTSTPGTYTVTYTIAAAGGCAAFSTTTTITITQLPAATINYAGSPYCSNAGTATVTRTGTAGGTYTATPAGLTLNATTGDVTLGTSTPGTYTVTYTIAAAGGCPQVTATASITVTALPAATINYAGSPYCTSSGTATVTRTGTAGGTYSAAPAGLTLNATTGDVTLATSTPGTYTVTYTIAAGGGCPAVTATASITVTAANAATISYAGTPYCSTVASAPVTRTGTAGGTYTAAPAGLTINATTGTVTPNTSTPGTYTVTYTMAATGGCPAATATTTITITQAPNMIIFYAGTPYCSNAGTATVSQFGTPGGTYSATPAGLSINATTGAVTLATSTPGTYTVTYSVTAPGCGITNTQTTITITAAPNATISYAGSPYCSNAGTAAVTQTGTTGGTYSAAPAGLSINATTGAVNLGASTPGTYTVTYTIAANGGCAQFTATATITITQLPAATIAYTGSPYCSNAGTATVTRTGTAGGTYTAAPAGLSINASTGAVTLATSTPGTYTVTYTIAAGGGCPQVTTTTTITVTALPAATITYAGNPFCQPGGIATVTRTGTAGGTYSATPAGLTINATTGDINVTTSTAGTYTVTYTLAATGGCPVQTATATVTINAPSTAPTGATATQTSLCGPGAVTLNVTGGALGSGATWRWYTGSCGGTAVGTGATLNVTVNTTTTYFVRAEGTCNTTACASVTVTVNTQPTISITTTATTIKPGQNAILTATVTPAGTPVQWFRDGIAVPGATATTLTVSVADYGTYTARATTAAGCTALSTGITIIAENVPNVVFVYPNPSQGQFQVRVYNQLGKQLTVVVYNSRGQRVYGRTQVTSAPYTRMDIDMRGVAGGQYTVVVVDGDGEVIGSREIVIAR